MADAYQEIGGKTVGCEVFGTFNSAELAILWTVDQFADVLYLIDHLRGLTFHFPGSYLQRAFISSHTFIAMGRKIPLEESQNTRGGALIQMAGRTSAGIGDETESGYDVVANYVRRTVARAESKLTNCPAMPNIMFCAGEYDLILQADPHLLPELFHQSEKDGEKSNFFINDAVFNAHILESTTLLYYRQEDVAELDAAMREQWVQPHQAGLLNVHIPKGKWCGQSPGEQMNIVDKIRVKNGGSGETANVHALFTQLRSQVARLLPFSSGFLSTIDLAYSDYIQCSTTTVDHLWVKDFDAQFQAALTILIKCWNPQDTAKNVSSPRAYLDLVQRMLHALQQQCYHVVDSGKLFFEEPRSHFSYTGQYDLLMHAYYGILKCLLELLYQPPRNQSILYPLINFESTPALRSTLYYENVDDVPEESPQRLLVIQLPYDSWTSLDHYIPMLIHEIYHYAAPFSRKRRNYLFGCILLTWLHTHALRVWLSALILDKSYHRPLKSVVTLIVNEAGKILSQQFARLAECLEGKEDAGSFKAHYLNRLTRFVESISEDYNDTLSELAISLKHGLEGLPSRPEWKYACELEDSKVRTEVNNETSKLFGELCSALSALANKRGGISEYYSLMKLSMREQWVPLLEILNELFPDVAMVRLAGLDTVGYLLQFSIDQNNKLMRPQDLAFQTYYRLGCIIDWTTHCLEQDETTNHRNASYCTTQLEEHRAHFYACYNRVCPGSTVSAEAWFNFYVSAYQYYLCYFPTYYTWLKQLVFEEYLPCLANPSNAVNQLTEHCKNYYTILECADQKKRESRLFQHTIQLVQSFQHQKDLGTIDVVKHDLKHDLNNPPATTAVKPFQALAQTFPKNKKWQFTLRTHSELHSHLEVMITQLHKSHQSVFGIDGMDDCKLWFRGCRNATYDILPSIMVHFGDGINAENFCGKNRMGTLLEYQWRLLEEYKFRVDGAPELLNSSQYQRLDYLALMQHYGQYTGLLDWSEDAYSSLYFAFENFVDNADMEIEAGKEEDAPAALYILDPRLYNRARSIIMKQIPNLSSEYLATIEGPDGYIPNLSIPENRDRFAMFIPGGCPTVPVQTKKSKRLILSPPFVHTTGCAPKDTELAHVLAEQRNLPLAIYAPRLNPRLRAQSGIFMSYNLRALPIQPECGATGKIKLGDLFHYLSLESIQRFFLEHFNEDPFMLKLSMSKNQKKEMGRILRSLGLNRYRVYPELEHLPKRTQKTTG